MSLALKFQKFLHQKTGFVQQHTFLIAVSGGIDSVVLCDLLYNHQVKFIMAHCNFQLRGEESERDEAFVKELANFYSKELFIKRFDTSAYADEHSLSIQVAARNLRYDWFRQLALEEGLANYIVTAHHADDNIETVLMNFFRGTGLKGLIGMDELYEKIWRPMLTFKKEEIVAYAQERQLKHVEDSSNAESNYTRNFFRNELLPSIATVFPKVEENLLQNIRRLTDVSNIYEDAIDALKGKFITVKGKEFHIPVLKLKLHNQLRTIVWEIVKDFRFSAAQVDEVIKLLDAENGSCISSSTHQIIKNRKWLIISLIEQRDNNFYIIEAGKKKVEFSTGIMLLEHEVPVDKVQMNDDNNIALVDYKEVHFPLMLRRWKQGDYFYPLGMKKKKKINRFLIDHKLSSLEKENVWVLESNKKIIWVIGYRIDDRFKIKSTTSTVLKVKVI